MTIDDLVAFGANTSEGLQRCLNKEDFYLRMVKKCLLIPIFRSFLTPLMQAI